MHTLLFALMSLAFFMLYNTSLKLKYERESPFSTWIRNNRKQTMVSAYALLVVSLVAFLFLDGWAIGGFTFFIGLMFIASLIITLYPLLLFRQKYIVLFLGCCFFFELLIF